MYSHERSNALELLDAEEIPREDLYRNLRELKFINRFLGGHAAVLAGFKKFKGFQTVLEIGSGGGDNLVAIKKKYAHATYTGVDLKADCTSYALANTDGLKFVTSDYKLYLPDNKPDIIFNSLFCHHFKDEDLIAMFSYMQANSLQGFVVADLHRHYLAYYAIKLLTALFSKSYLVKNDAPLSVNRGFKKSELVKLLDKAGIKNYTISWQWAFRYVIVVKND